MKLIHTPRVNLRYWAAILLASVFGTNMGDLYAHDSGLKIGSGLLVLAALTALVFVLERFSDRHIEFFYWAVICLIRTGATNIADYLAYRVRIPDLALTGGLLVLMGIFAWGTSRGRGSTSDGEHSLPPTNAFYWLAMLAAGVFGTVAGDLCQDAIGRGTAAIVLLGALVVFLALVRERAARSIVLYWSVIAFARTAGTAVGDWIAGRGGLHLGLGPATVLSGAVFVAILMFWPGAMRTRRLSAAA